MIVLRFSLETLGQRRSGPGPTTCRPFRASVCSAMKCGQRGPSQTGEEPRGGCVSRCAPFLPSSDSLFPLASFSASVFPPPGLTKSPLVPSSSGDGVGGCARGCWWPQGVGTRAARQLPGGHAGTGPPQGGISRRHPPPSPPLVLSPPTSFWAVAAAHWRGHGAGVHFEPRQANTLPPTASPGGGFQLRP